MNLFRARRKTFLKITKTKKWFVFYPQLCREDHKDRHIYFNEQQQQQTATTKTIIIPEGRIMNPRAVCMISDMVMIVGECKTGLAKRIKYFEEKT